jgi:post-segregation antitoxin (ccd killing protein)
MRARDLGINVSAAAREGVAEAVRACLAESNRAAHLRSPERQDVFWEDD